MAISNNVTMTNSPIRTGNLSQVKKNEQTSDNNSSISSVNNKASVEKSDNTTFSMVLSKQQQDTINDTIGYDQPSAKERGAVDAYRQVATQEKREQVMDSMSFHFVV
ncbi:hypothetical protein N8878_05845 [Psychromonas sp.]|nr:hypothetical protein [Psychromonas sp.]